MRASVLNGLGARLAAILISKFKCFRVVYVCRVPGTYCNTRRFGGIDRGGHRNGLAVAHWKPSTVIHV